MSDIQSLLNSFEKGLNPQSPEKSVIKAKVKGYGEISSIFAVDGIPGWIFKRLPLFSEAEEANIYLESYTRYTKSLKDAGLILPADQNYIVEGSRVVLYVGQEEIAKEDFCHNLIHSLSAEEGLTLINSIFLEIKKVWAFNQENQPVLELSIDGQISNWARINSNLVYVDTSTPMFKRDGQEQLDPELLLNSTPGALKWIIRKYFLQDVMNRYYDLRLVFIDLVANLYKEQKTDLIAGALDLANKYLPEGVEDISRKEIDAYYKDDKFTWQLFLSFRKIDRWVANKIQRKQYQFILPGKIKR